jgi:hypothetical protein
MAKFENRQTPLSSMIAEKLPMTMVDTIAIQLQINFFVRNQIYRKLWEENTGRRALVRKHWGTLE